MVLLQWCCCSGTRGKASNIKDVRIGVQWERIERTGWSSDGNLDSREFLAEKPAEVTGLHPPPPSRLNADF